MKRRSQPKASKEGSSPKRNAPAPAALERVSTMRSPGVPAPDGKCLELRDLLGDYSEQTGSLFG